MKELSLSFGHLKREDELPLTIIVNGCTYQSQPLVDATKKTYFEMGKQHGMELGSDNTYSDNEMSSMHDAWYDNGYTKGYEAGYEAGIDHGIEKTLQDDRVKEELERTKQTWYAKGKEEGYEAGKWDLPAGHSRVENLTYKHGWSCGYNEGFEEGKSEGYDEGYEAGKRDQFNDDNKLIDESNERNTKLIDEGMKVARKLGYNEGFEEGKSAGYDEGYEAGKSEYSVKLEERLKSRYISVHIDGYEQCKHDGISKINLNTESVEQTELSKEYDKGFTKGFEEGKSESYGKGWIEGHNTASIKYFDEYSVKLEERLKSRYDDGYNDGYEQGKKNPECGIPGEYLSRIEEARLMGYEQGRSDCIEATLQKKLLQEHIMKSGIDDEDGVIMESGDDEEDGEPIGPEQPEYDKGYYEGYEDGRNKRNYFRQNK
jgi:flagellar biosynthesis/type III secretory pathway protein FliH